MLSMKGGVLEKVLASARASKGSNQQKRLVFEISDDGSTRLME